MVARLLFPLFFLKFFPGFSQLCASRIDVFTCCSQHFPKRRRRDRPFLVATQAEAAAVVMVSGGQTRRNIGQVSVFLTLREVSQARGGGGGGGDVFMERSTVQATNHSSDGLIQKAAGSDPSVGLGERAADYGSSLGLAKKMHCNRDPRWHPNCAFFFNYY